MDKYAFLSREHLTSVGICADAAADSEIILGDRVFEYCSELETATIGYGTIKIGKYAFSGCADSIGIVIEGKEYTEEAIKDGIKELSAEKQHQ